MNLPAFLNINLGFLSVPTSLSPTAIRERLEATAPDYTLLITKTGFTLSKTEKKRGGWTPVFHGTIVMEGGATRVDGVFRPKPNVTRDLLVMFAALLGLIIFNVISARSATAWLGLGLFIAILAVIGAGGWQATNQLRKEFSDFIVKTLK